LFPRLRIFVLKKQPRAGFSRMPPVDRITFTTDHVVVSVLKEGPPPAGRSCG
jgi:hypothetical protein